MASTKKTLNPLTDTPTTKTEVTKSFMFAYMKQVASPEELEWFQNLVTNPNYQKEYFNKFTRENYIDINIPLVRKEFIARFFPNLDVKKKKNQSFIDSIMALKK